MSLFKSVISKKFKSINRLVRSNDEDALESDRPSTRQRLYSVPSAIHVIPEEPSKKKPSGYLFLLKSDPLVDWNVVADLPSNFSNETQDKQVLERVLENKKSNLLAHAKVYEKFSDDHLDEYLFEMGILDEYYMKFDDLMAEIEMLRGCSHKNVIKFFDAYFFSTKLWIMTEYCPHGSIEKLMNDLDKPLNQLQIEYIVKEVLHGLVYLNERCRIVHADLKSNNLLIADDYSIKISNFHISAKNSRVKDEEKRYFFIQSPHFMAPELVSFQRLTDDSNDKLIKSDVWSLGITCIEMAERFPPFWKLNPQAVVDQIKSSKKKIELTKDLDRWSSSFMEFIFKCLTRNPDLRPSASELLKHALVQNSKGTKAEIQNLIVERKSKSFNQTRDVLNKLESKVTEMKQMKDFTELYVSNYFQDIRNSIDLKCQEAKEKIESDRLQMIESLKNFEEECFRNIETFSQTDKNQIDNLSKAYEQKYLNWNLYLCGKEVKENVLVKTQKEVGEMDKSVEKELNSLKSVLFSDRNIKFEPVDKEEIKFGDFNLVKELKNKDNGLKPILKASFEDEAKSKEGQIVDDEQSGFQMKALNKPIRFELKQTRRKSTFNF